MKKSSNNERKRGKRFIFCGYQGRYKTILAVILCGKGGKILANRGKRYDVIGRKVLGIPFLSAARMN